MGDVEEKVLHIQNQVIHHQVHVQEVEVEEDVEEDVHAHLVIVHVEERKNVVVKK